MFTSNFSNSLIYVVIISKFNIKYTNFWHNSDSIILDQSSEHHFLHFLLQILNNLIFQLTHFL